MFRFFINIKDNTVILDKDDIFKIVHVIRLKKGDFFEGVFNKEVYICEILNISKKDCLSNIVKKIDSYNELNCNVRLLYMIPKGQKIDLVIQKCVELGVNSIVLINGERSVARINTSNYNSKISRFNKICKEAAEQSKRNIIPQVIDILENINFCSKFDDADYKLICSEKETNSEITLMDLAKQFKGKKVNILIGPEGGFSIDEFKRANEHNYKSISLGKRILRTETACISIMSVISLLCN